MTGLQIYMVLHDCTHLEDSVDLMLAPRVSKVAIFPEDISILCKRNAKKTNAPSRSNI